MALSRVLGVFFPLKILLQELGITHDLQYCINEWDIDLDLLKYIQELEKLFLQLILIQPLGKGNRRHIYVYMNG